MASAQGDPQSSHLPRPASRLALIVSADEWCGDALHSVLEAGGYRVLRVPASAQTLEIVIGAAPDVILVAVGSPHADAVELCRRLREETSRTAGTAIIMIAAAPTNVAQRLAGLRAGAWDVLALPMNAEELLAKLDACVGVKLEADRIRTVSLLDSVSGLYAVRGVECRARELLADASRHHLALACVVLGVDPQIEDEPAGEDEAVSSTRVLEHVAKLLHTHGRLSDIIGRWNDTDFAVLAPGTHAAGAIRLAQRLGHVVEASPPPVALMRRLKVRAGYEAVDDAGTTNLRAADLLAHAESALQNARAERDFPPILRYSREISHQAPL